MADNFRFGSYELDLAAGQLYKRGIRIGLRNQSFQVLRLLLEHPREVVTREDLRHRLWPDDLFVDFENNLNTAVARLRVALCDSADHPRFIETLPKHGYRFISPVDVLSRSPNRETRRSRVLVMPFLNMSGDPAEEYFSDAMTEEIITAMAAFAAPRMAVIARTTAMRYKGSHKDVARIGRELNIDYVVEGGVRRSGTHVFVNVQLVDAADQTHLFARRYEGEMRDIFTLHRRIARAITRHIVPNGSRKRVPRRQTENLAAYNEYIKGRSEIYRLTADGTMNAKRHFEVALARDPNFALACNSLAELHWYLGICGFAPSRQMDLLGRSYALRALQIDSSSADTHALLSFFPTKRNSPDEIDYYDWEQIQDRIARAIELDRNSRLVRLRHAMVLTELGDPEAAVVELQNARESDPLSLDVNAWLVIMLYLSGHLNDALRCALEVRELEPEHFVPYNVLGQAYLAMKRFDESAAAFREAARLSQLPFMLGWLGLCLGLGGRIDEARVVLGQLHVIAAERYVLPTSFAWTHFGLGELDEFFVWMDRAVDAPDRMLEGIKTYPFFDPSRSDPRFKAVLRRMNLG